MFPSFIPADAEKLTELTSIELTKKIECQRIVTPLCEDAIATTYVRQGEGGIPILLLHGFDSSLLEFRRLVPLLASKQETWAIDLLGFGFSDRIPNLSFGAKQIKTHLYAFWQTLMKKPMILVGASMGGAAAIDFTVTYPEAVEKLVLLDSAGLAKEPTVGKFMFPPLDYLATEFLRNAWVRRNISRAAYYDKSLVSADAELCAALHLNLPNWNKALISFTKCGGYGSFLEKVSQIEQETLILWGTNDKILGVKDAYLFEEAISNSKLIWIQDCGHVPHLEKPQITAEHILNFGA